MPSEIARAMRECSVKDINAAWHRLQNMCGGMGVEQRRAMKIPESAMSILMENRCEEFTRIAISLLNAVRKAGLDPDVAIRDLERIGMLYDNAAGIVYKKRFYDNTLAEPMGDKIDIYRAIDCNPDAVKAITEFDVIHLISTLCDRSAFLAKIVTELVCERPDLLSEVLMHEHRPQTFEDFRKEMKNHLGQVDQKVAEEGVTSSTVSVAKAIHEWNINALKNFNKLGLVRIGYLCTEVLLGRLTELQIKSLYEEMTNLSLVSLDGLYGIERDYLIALYGTPSSEFAIILSGANSRREFPAFDYDAMGVIEKDGETSGGVQGKKTNRKFFNALFENIADSTTNIGHNLDRNFIREDRQGRPLNCVTPEDYLNELRAMGFEDPFVYLGLDNLSFGCGDGGVADRMIGIAEELVRENAADLAAAQLIRREVREDMWRNVGINIKESKGGLRDIMDLMVVYKAVEEVPEKNIFDLIDVIGIEPNQRNVLMASYCWLMNLRVRLDLEYGRNHKHLPTQQDLQRFVRILGYQDRDGKDAVDLFMDDFQHYSGTVRKVTDELLTSAIDRHPEITKRVEYTRKFLNKIREEINRDEEMRMQMEFFHESSS